MTADSWTIIAMGLTVIASTGAMMRFMWAGVGGRLDGVDARLTQVDRRFDQVDRRFDEVDRRFVQVDRRFVQVDERFDQVDRRFEQVDRRFDQQDELLRVKLDAAARVSEEQFFAVNRRLDHLETDV